MNDSYSDVFEGELVLELADPDYSKVDGDSDTRKKYDEI